MYEKIKFTNQTIYLKGEFICWASGLTHNEFIMRYPNFNQDKDSTSIDLFFSDTFYVELPFSMPIDRIELATQQEQVLLEQKYGRFRIAKEQQHIAFRYGDKFSYFIGCGSLHIIKHSLRPYQISSNFINRISVCMDSFPDINATQYVVCQANVVNHLLLDENGLEYADSLAGGKLFQIFQSKEEAVNFCKNSIAQYPLRECIILDYKKKKVDSFCNYNPTNNNNLKKNALHNKWWRFWEK